LTVEAGEEVDLGDVIARALEAEAPDPDEERAEELVDDREDGGDEENAPADEIDDEAEASEDDGDEADDDSADDADEDEAEAEPEPAPDAEKEQLRQERDELLRIAAQLQQQVQQAQQPKAPQAPKVPPIQMQQSRKWLFPSDEAEDRAAKLFHAYGAGFDSTDEGKKALGALGLTPDQAANAKQIAGRRTQFWERAMADPRVLVQEFVMPAVQQHLAGVMGPIQAERDEQIRRQYFEAHGLHTAEEQSAVTRLVSSGWTPEGAALKVNEAKKASQLSGREKKVNRRERDQEARKRGRRRSGGRRSKGSDKNKARVNTDNMSLSEFLENAVDAAGLE